MRTDPPATAFLGAPIQSDLSELDAEVVILGVPFGWPYPRPGLTAGCADAPAAVRRRSERLAAFRGHWDFDAGERWLPLEQAPRLVDAGDVPGDPSDGPGNSARATRAAATILERGAVPICIGGDDSVTIPVLRAFEGRGPLTVVQVDAHLDYRHEVEGVEEGYSSPMRRASEMAHVERIVHVGLRGVGSARDGEVQDSIAAGNLLVTARELHDLGVRWLLEQVPPDASVFLAFDCDGLDPSVFPAVSGVSPGGLTYPQAWDLVSGLGSRVVGAVFTEYLPQRDVNDVSALVACRLVAGLVQRCVVSTKS